jgi:hypothetical protein
VLNVSVPRRIGGGGDAAREFSDSRSSSGPKGANETPPPWGGEAGFRRPSRFFVWREETSEVTVEGLTRTTPVSVAGSRSRYAAQLFSIMRALRKRDFAFGQRWPGASALVLVVRRSGPTTRSDRGASFKEAKAQFHARWEAWKTWRSCKRQETAR